MAATASSPPRMPVIVKLGGSAITHKTQQGKVNSAALSASVDALARAHDAGLALIVVHGAGSFGHHEATEHKLQSPALPSAALALGIAQTRAAVTKLNAEVVRQLVDAGVPAVGVPLLPAWVTAGVGAVQQHGSAVVQQLLHAGLVPVLHGDVVLDATESRTCTVLSGDTVVPQLTQYLPSTAAAVFVSSVAGVYTAAPDEGAPTAGQPVPRLVQHVRCGASRDAEDAVAWLEGGDTVPLSSIACAPVQGDVTGGMQGKLDAALQTAQRVPVWLTCPAACGAALTGLTQLLSKIAAPEETLDMTQLAALRQKVGGTLVMPPSQ